MAYDLIQNVLPQTFYACFSASIRGVNKFLCKFASKYKITYTATQGLDIEAQKFSRKIANAL